MYKVYEYKVYEVKIKSTIDYLYHDGGGIGKDVIIFEIIRVTAKKYIIPNTNIYTSVMYSCTRPVHQVSVCCME